MAETPVSLEGVRRGLIASVVRECDAITVFRYPYTAGDIAAIRARLRTIASAVDLYEQFSKEPSDGRG